MSFDTVEETLYPEPVVGIEVFPNENSSTNDTDQILIGYRIVRLKSTGRIFTRPRLHYMNQKGWIATIVLVVVCFPLAILPSLFSSSYDTFQIPVYTTVVPLPHNKTS